MRGVITLRQFLLECVLDFPYDAPLSLGLFAIALLIADILYLLKVISDEALDIVSDIIYSSAFNCFCFWTILYYLFKQMGY